MGRAIAGGMRVAGAGLAVLGASAAPLLGAALLVRPSRVSSSSASASTAAASILDSTASAALLGLVLALAMPHAAHVLTGVHTDPAASSSASSASSASSDSSASSHGDEHEAYEGPAGLFGILLLLSVFLLWSIDSLVAALPHPVVSGRAYAPLVAAQEYELPEELPRAGPPCVPSADHAESHEMAEWDAGEADESSPGEERDAPSGEEWRRRLVARRRRSHTPRARHKLRWCTAFLARLAQGRAYTFIYHLFLPFDPTQIRPSMTTSTLLSLCLCAIQVGAGTSLLPLVPALTLSTSFALLLATRLAQPPVLAPLLLTIPFLLLGWAAEAIPALPQAKAGPAIVSGMLLYSSVRNLRDASLRFHQAHAQAHAQAQARPRPGTAPTAPSRLPLTFPLPHPLRRRTQSLHLPSPLSPGPGPATHARSRSQPSHLIPAQDPSPSPPLLLRPWLRLLLMALAAWAPTWLVWACHLPGN